MFGPEDRDLLYALTPEWPFRGQRHQLSYTIPIRRMGDQVTGLGDVLLNYRLQIGGGSPWAAAPRLSVIIPTGSVRHVLGDGTAGVQVNLPLSLQHGSSIATHWNAGATLLPRAQEPSGSGGRPRRTLIHYALGGSIIAPVQFPVQLMLEQRLLFEGAIGGTGPVSRTTSWVTSPGVRAAINLGRLQVVPGVAVPLTRTDGRTQAELLLYLSLEHPFKTVGTERR